VPIINENDTVAVEEIKFGDNDNLSALVATNIGAGLLVLLSSMNGLHDRDPHQFKDANRITVVADISKIEGMHGKSNRGGVGGIDSKIQAAKVAVESGIPMAIVDSGMKDVLKKAVSGGDVGTFFIPKKRLDSRLSWMLYSSECVGAIVVDEGAKNALEERNVSLLPSGVVAVRGKFEKGDTVKITDDRDVEFARGITNYSKHEIELIKGKHSAEIEKILGGGGYKEVVYRGNMVLT
ncbi:MAG: glutamate 5-kinase, partial [Candidatus Altiarchaeota archaeon]|nr:glutamate 5-kinase [Candidatus Altiarchaeota archaeon]